MNLLQSVGAWYRGWMTKTYGTKPSAARTRGGRRRSLQTGPVPVEKLEQRALLNATYPSIDGTGHNLQQTSWGSTGIDLLRKAPVDYDDGISTPAGADRPSAREISNTVAAQSDSMPNNRNLSNFVYAWGQFIDHDLDLTHSASPTELFNIAIPQGDPQFDPSGTGTQVMPFARANYNPATGTSTSNPRQQVNDITAWLDGSMVYGSDATRAAALRTFVGGRMKTGDGNLMPSNTDGLPNANINITPNDQMFLAGDVRANENLELSSIHVLFLREHNQIADRIARSNPTLSDEAVYQQARLRVIAEIQAITYNEFLPALLGPNALRAYRGYNPQVNPGIANEFSTAAFRVGHTMVGEETEFLDDQGNEVREAVSLREAFFNPNLLRETGVDPILKYLASDHAEEIDTKVVDSLRNFLFGPPGAGGMDLPALNIQRGRDHGLADLNSARVAYGLPRLRSFADITRNVDLQQKLQSLYGDVNNVDLWVGGLAEDHIPGGSVGPTFTRIIADQFQRLRDGDRFWYQNVFKGRELLELQQTHLVDVIRRNTGLRNLQDNVFIFQTTVTGRVFADANRDGVASPRERGVAGRTIQVLDLEGNVVATTQTDRNGVYTVRNLPLGLYTVREVLPENLVNTTPASRSVSLTKGMTIPNLNFGEATAPTTTVAAATASLGNLLSAGTLSGK